MRRIENNGPVHVYREYGDRRPPVDHLYSLFWHADDQVGENVGTLCTMADMCIDLAMSQAEDNNDWFATAEETLDEAYATTMDMHHRGYTVSLSTAAKALLRKSELPRWRQASVGTPPTPPDYRESLALVEKILPLAEIASAQQDGPASELREFMPLLLGARATSLRLNGWQGRLSLDREDCRPLGKLTLNPNWDTGIMRTPTAESFTLPEDRLQIKNSCSEARSAEYQRAGIRLMQATEYGFGDFADIIDRANTELELIAAGRTFSPVTQYLNSLTGTVRQGIREPLHF